MTEEKNIYREIGKELRVIRESKGITQESLAFEAHVDPKSVINIEGGKRNPTIEILEKIAKVLNAELVIEFHPKK